MSAGRDVEPTPFSANQSGQEENPYASPLSAPEMKVVQPASSLVSVPCPNCQSTSSWPVPYDPAMGRAGPRAIDHMECLDCGAQFNGESGVLIVSRMRSHVIYPALALSALVLLVVVILLFG